jgi:hypothetical protein
MAESTTPLLDRLKKIQAFTIDVTLKEGVTIPGFIPYDMKTDPRVGRVVVQAVSRTEAEEVVKKYLV